MPDDAPSSLRPPDGCPSAPHDDGRIATPDELDRAVRGLARTRPDLSAAGPIPPWQLAALLALAIAIVLLPLALPAAWTLIAALLALPFGAHAALRIWAILAWRSARPEPTWQGSADKRPAVDHAAPAPFSALPRYTILVPLYREARALPRLIVALQAIDYPCDCLQVVLVLEEDDEETRAALAGRALPGHIEILLVPPCQPRTKPKALNVALTRARGEFVVVFDAEDEPEPDQLRRALALLAADPGLGCVQACLNVYNPRAGWLTRQFTAEYSVLFDAMLPQIVRLGWPVPLGGTSNHFRRSVLEAVGGWDSHNVTEDADLGVRLARAGWRVAMTSSTTWEEAPSRWPVWIGQRTRWLKGWMQTYLVHMRDPRRLWRELGPSGFLGFQLMIGGVLLSAFVHPWFLVELAHLLLVPAPSREAGAPAAELLSTATAPPALLTRHAVWSLAWINLAAGYLSGIGIAWMALVRRGRHDLAFALLILPIYWLAISLAAYRALAELLRRPFHWEKTEHAASPASLPELGPHGPARSRPTPSSRSAD